MALYKLTQGDSFPRLSSGDEVALLAGVHRPFEFGGVTGVTLRGEPGAVVKGSLVPRGGEPQCSIRIHDGADRLKILGPLEIVGSYGRGLRVTGATGITIQDVNSHGHGIEAIETGDCPGAVYQRLTLWGSRPENEGDQEYPRDKRHGLYISGDASGSVVTDLHAYDVTGSGFQANGPGMGAVIKAIHVSRMLLERCGSGGTPPISLMGVRDSVIEEFCVIGTAADRWAVLFADGRDGYECRGVTFRTYSIPAGTHAAEEEGSTGNTFTPGKGFAGLDAPPLATEPTPAPAPAPAPVAPAPAPPVAPPAPVATPPVSPPAPPGADRARLLALMLQIEALTGEAKTL